MYLTDIDALRFFQGCTDKSMHEKAFQYSEGVISLEYCSKTRYTFSSERKCLWALDRAECFCEIDVRWKEGPISRDREV